MYISGPFLLDKMSDYKVYFFRSELKDEYFTFGRSTKSEEVNFWYFVRVEAKYNIQLKYCPIKTIFKHILATYFEYLNIVTRVQHKRC